MKKVEIIEKLKELKAKFDPSAHHSTLGALLRKLTSGAPEEVEPKDSKVIKLQSVIRRRNSYVNPVFRREKADAVLNKVIGARQYKGKIEKVVTTVYMEVNDNDELVTEMTVHLK